MRPVDQTKFGDEGNCFAACIASILECPLESVPDAMQIHRSGKSWRHVLKAWLAERDLAHVNLRVGNDGWDMLMPQSYHIIGGSSPRGCAEGHSVVGYKGQMVHDPHPDRGGLVNVEEFGFFIRLFPENK